MARGFGGEVPEEAGAAALRVSERTWRRRHRRLWPRGAYETKDGYVALNVPDNIIWSRLCKAMGRDDLIDDDRAATGTARSANVDTLQPIIEGWLGTLTCEEAVETLNAKGVPCGPIYTAEEVFDDPQVKARGMIIHIEDPEFGTFGFAPFVRAGIAR